MEKMEIKEYLQELLDKWNKYDELDGFTADSFRNDLEKTLEYWDLRIADNKEELDKAREEVLTELQEEFSEFGVPDDVRYTKPLFYINEVIEEKLSKLKQ